jgi:hypothetical protein
MRSTLAAAAVLLLLPMQGAQGASQTGPKGPRLLYAKNGSDAKGNPTFRMVLHSGQTETDDFGPGRIRDIHVRRRDGNRHTPGNLCADQVQIFAAIPLAGFPVPTGWSASATRGGFSLFGAPRRSNDPQQQPLNQNVPYIIEFKFKKDPDGNAPVKFPAKVSVTSNGTENAPTKDSQAVATFTSSSTSGSVLAPMLTLSAPNLAATVAATVLGKALDEPTLTAEAESAFAAGETLESLTVRAAAEIALDGTTDAVAVVATFSDADGFVSRRFTLTYAVSELPGNPLVAFTGTGTEFLTGELAIQLRHFDAPLQSIEELAALAAVVRDSGFVDRFAALGGEPHDIRVEAGRSARAQMRVEIDLLLGSIRAMVSEGAGAVSVRFVGEGE